MNKSTIAPPHEVGAASDSEPPRVKLVRDKGATHKGMPQLIAEELRKVMVVVEGGKTKSMTKGEVIAAQFINRAATGDMALLTSLLRIIKDLPLPPDDNTWVFRGTPEQIEAIEFFGAIDTSEYRRDD